MAYETGSNDIKDESGLRLAETYWNNAYNLGSYNFLNEVSELARYAIIAAYVRHYVIRGALLDVGCGEGILRRYLSPLRLKRYIGIDVSNVALAKAVHGKRTTYVKASVEDYRSDEELEAIVFNEVLYYVKEPTQVLARYAKFLSVDGIMVISMFHNAKSSIFSARVQVILQYVKDTHMTILDETRLTNICKDLTWTIAVLQPRGKPRAVRCGK